ncbi:hypothetical protein [Enterocloster citroniae]|uniref:beta-sandwich lipoprotein n=1 Tax=Enterocloster citroniae TaxID=358743 RepID=UPI002E7A3F56|nr:hypothetical protein [Enterocloster citroniae]
MSLRENFMKKIKFLAVVLLAFILLYGCTEAERVSSNVSQQADNFNVIRRLTVLNARSDKPLFELVGAFSFTLENDRIIAVVETGPGEYKKHSVGLNDWTLWVIEDVSGAEVDKYHYEVNFLPEMIVPVTFINED